MVDATSQTTTRGRLITLEGGEGVGKSTQAGRLVDALARVGIDAVVTREPGGSPFGEALRPVLVGHEFPDRVPLADALVFSAARVDHIAHTIEPALAAGRWVICDRFIDSTRVYQGLSLPTELGTLTKLEALTVPASAYPSLTIVLDMAVEGSVARAAARHAAAGGGVADRFEGQGADYHEMLREGFLAIVDAEPDRCVLVDAAQPADDVSQQVWAIVAARLGIERGAT